MSEADAAQWDEIQQWKASQLSDKRPRAITQKMKSAALAPVGKAVSIARKVPGGEALTRTMSSAALGLVELAASASEARGRTRRDKPARHPLSTPRPGARDQASPEPRILGYGSRGGGGQRRVRLRWLPRRCARHGCRVGARRGRHRLGDGRRYYDLPGSSHASRRPHRCLLRLRLRGSLRAPLFHDGALPGDRPGRQRA